MHLQTRIDLGLAYMKLFRSAEYKESLDLLIQAEWFARKNGDTVSLAKINRFLGFNYRFLSRYQKALEHLDQAILLSRYLRDTTQLISAMNEKANVYYFMNDRKLRRETRLEALDLAMRSGNLHAQSYIRHDLGCDYVRDGEHAKAVNYFRTNLRYSMRAGEAREVSIAAENIAEAFLTLNLTDSAEHYLIIADSAASKGGFVYEQSLVYKTYSKLYEKMNDYARAYDYLRKFHVVSDTIFNLEKEVQINEITARYESDRKEQENRMLKQQYRNTLIISVIIAAFVVSIILLLLWMNRRKQAVNRQLEERNKLIQTQKNDLSEAFSILKKHEEELAAVNASKNIFFTIIAHDLKNPFTALLGFSELLTDDYDSFKEEERRQMMFNIRESAQGIFRLLENLLEWTRTQTGRIEAKPEPFDLGGVIRKNISLFKTAAGQKNVTMTCNLQHPVPVKADEGMIDFIVRNLLSNAIKYVNKGGRIRFHVTFGKEVCQLAVTDDGIGIPPENLKKLFRIDGKVRTNGTANEKGTGLGLIICKEFIRYNNGSIHAESTIGAGSTFTITIPSA
jgi:signal transduction histidine kinase